MTCRCGRRTTRPDLCKFCAREDKWAGIDEVDFQYYECPGCDGKTSGKGVLCYKCRGNGGEQ